MYVRVCTYYTHKRDDFCEVNFVLYSVNIARVYGLQNAFYIPLLTRIQEKYNLTISCSPGFTRIMSNFSNLRVF